MKSKRIQAICSFLDLDDAFIDIGSDHAYVPIEMYRKGSKNILATDISLKVLEIARKNIADFQYSIPTILSDGLKNIDTTHYNTLVITGMGTNTIKNILSEEEKLKPIQKIILQSNLDLYELRFFMMEKGYFLEEEKIVLEKKHYYTIMKYKKQNQKLSFEELHLGLFQKENKEYYEWLKRKMIKVFSKIPNGDFRKDELKRLIEALSTRILMCEKS